MIDPEEALSEERIEGLTDTDEGLDLLEELDIPESGITTIGGIKKALRLYLRDQIRKTFRCEKCDLKESDIEGVEDILGARYLLTQHHIEADHVESMQEARTLLETHFQDKLRLEPYDLDEVAEVVHRLMDESTQGRLKLLSKYNRVKAFLPRIPKARREDLDHQLPHLDQDMEYVHEMINKDNCTIMIAGETGAGKTCLLNLLLGELASELLPVSNLPQTSAICEIKYGETGMLKTCPVDKSIAAETIELEATTAPETIAGYVSERDCRVLKYSKVEVYWPCEWIKHGITITDTPGVGETSEFTQVVKDYIPKASGFIYVINTPNAGGINAEELGELLFYHITSEGIRDVPVGQRHEEIKFDPRSAIFVCNKWDQVKPEEKEEVKNYVKTSLQKVWRGFDFENQVFFISVQEIVREIQNGYVPKEYRRLLAGIQNLLPIGFKSRMEKQFWKMYNIVDRSIFILNNYIRCDHHRGRQEKKDQYRNALARLDDLGKRPKKARAEMNTTLNEEVQFALKRIREHLNSTEVQKKLTDWKESECPDNDNLDRLVKLQLASAHKRIIKEIHEFEEQQQIFENIQKKLISKFESIFVSVDNELHNIETAMREDPDPRSLLTPYYETEASDTHKKKGLNVFKGKGPIWAPLGVVIGAFTLPFLGSRAKKLNRRVSEYQTDKPTEMARITTDQVKELISTNNNKLKQVIEDKLHLIKRKFDLLLDRIPDLIKANRVLLIQLEQEIDTATSFGDYIPLVKEGESIKDVLNYDYLNYVRSYDIEFAKLNITNQIGKGGFAMVYRGTYETNGKATVVAVKRLLKPVSEDNSTAFLMEELNMKRLQSPYVINYLGTSMKRIGLKIYPAMVLEYCEFTLDSILFSTGTYKGPGKVAENDSERAVLLERAARYADEICKGITAIHQLGIVHRDLKPDNILLDVDGHLKICDLGLAIRERDITGEIAGAKVYMAPEILEGRPYDRSVDMFSFGMISWEIWYGESIDTMYDGTNYEVFMKKPFPDYEPVPQWKEVFMNCCSLKSCERLRADQCSTMFSGLYTIQEDDAVLNNLSGVKLS